MSTVGLVGECARCVSSFGVSDTCFTCSIVRKCSFSTRRIPKRMRCWVGVGGGADIFRVHRCACERMVG